MNQEGLEPVDAVRGLGRHVLVVDDDASQRKLLELQLTISGFAVTALENAEKAFQFLATNRPDVIVSDVLMDGMDGFSFCQQLRSNAALADIPVILLSMYFDEVADRELAEQVGAKALVARTPSMQACIDAIVQSLAPGPTSQSSQPATAENHLSRIAHRLVKFRNETENAEARYHAVFDHANDAMSLLTADGVVVDVNQRWEELTQRSREELIGRHVKDFSAIGHEDRNFRRYRETIGKEAGRDSVPVPIQRADGTILYLEFTTAKITIDGSERILGIGRDVTELVHSQRRLEASERKYRSLVENIPEVIFSSSREMGLTYISPNVLRMTGYSADELSAAPGLLLERMHPADVAHFGPATEALKEKGAPLDIECRWQHRDGGWLWLRMRAALARDEDGNECIDGVISDVTARKHLEEQLIHSQKIEAIGQLTAGIAHDFNNILCVLIANADVLAAQLSPGEEEHEIAGEIATAARRGADLTQRLLAFARRETAEPRDVDLNALIDGVERMLQVTLSSGRKLVFDPAPELGSIRADPRQLEQVLMNLTVNARDAMPNGGTLHMVTRNLELTDSATVPGLTPGNYVTLRVEDEGGGMDAATRERIFEPFFTTKGEKGTGLGLSTSYGIIRRYGGHVTVDSEPGEGTVFTLYFPRMERLPS